MLADWPRQALVGLVKGYRLLLSPWLGNSCRFEPTCSVYAIGALQRHGIDIRRIGPEVGPEILGHFGAT